MKTKEEILIQELENLDPDYNKEAFNEFMAGEGELTDFMKALMKAMEAYTSQFTTWIPVKERLPDEGVEVLLFVSDEIVQGYLKDGYWKGSYNVTSNMNDGYVNDRVICRQGSSFDTVTHWMPLPLIPTKP